MVVVIYITLNSMLRLPPRGKLSAKRTDEGKACGSDPLTGNHGKRVLIGLGRGLGHLPPSGEGLQSANASLHLQMNQVVHLHRIFQRQLLGDGLGKAADDQARASSSVMPRLIR